MDTLILYLFINILSIFIDSMEDIAWLIETRHKTVYNLDGPKFGWRWVNSTEWLASVNQT